MVVAELRGERIDVVPWSDDPSQLVANALSPAKVSRVTVSDADRCATVIVPDDQLSLAIGKEGQNARLAAKLTGWRIDIKSASQAFESGLTDVAPDSGDAERVEGDGRCCAVTASGVRCRNRAKPGTSYCSLHDKEAAK
jgi:N utilization substance protein A